MKKIIVLLLFGLLLFTGCANNSAPSLDSENISPVEAQKAASKAAKQTEPTQTEPQESEKISDNSSVLEKMALIGFTEVSGYYTRNVLEEETEYVEMFSFDKNTFVRMTTNDLGTGSICVQLSGG